MSLAVLACAPATADAQPAKLDFALSIDAPADARCTSAKALQDVIEARVGRLVFLDDPHPARRIDVQVQRDAQTRSWSAAIVMRDAAAHVVGERRVEAQGEGCSELDEALTVVIATLIGIADEAHDTEHAAKPEPPPPSAAERTKPKDDTPAGEGGTDEQGNPDQSRPPPAPPEPPGPPLHVDWIAALSAGADVGLLPGLAPRITGGLALDFGGWALVLDGTLFPYARHDLGLGAEARFFGGTGSAGLCVSAARFGRSGLSFCARAEAGALRVATSGLYTDQTRYSAILRAGVGPQLSLAFGRRWGGLVALEAAIPLLFPRYFYFDASGDRHYYHSVGLGVAARIGAYWLFSS